jgi:hypothetical protein
MDLTTFLLFQFLGHLLADFFFQTNKMAHEKNDKGFKTKYLAWHILIVFSCSWLFSFQVKFIVGAAAIAIIHYFIDGLKAVVNKKPKLAKYAFFVDQALHLGTLFLVSILFLKYHGFEMTYDPEIHPRYIAIVIAYLCCLKPANIVIKQVFKSSEIDVAIARKIEEDQLNPSDELPNAGKLIGTLERILTLTFIIGNHFEAVGFLIAAKSILRYRDTETLKTEYVLIGTMLSFGIAVMLGSIILIF